MVPGRVARTAQWVEQAGKGGKRKVGRVSWVEQAGKGGKRKVGRLALVVPSAPPLARHMKILVETSEL